MEALQDHPSRSDPLSFSRVKFHSEEFLESRRNIPLRARCDRRFRRPPVSLSQHVYREYYARINRAFFDSVDQLFSLPPPCIGIFK